MTLPWNSVATAVGGERSCRPGWLLSPPRRRSQRCRRWQVFQLGTWGPNNKVGSFREIYSNCLSSPPLCGRNRQAGRGAPQLAGMSSFESSPGVGRRVMDESVHSAASIHSTSNAPILQFAIDHSRLVHESQGWPYTSYRLLTTYQGQAFAVERRFREFRELHALLRRSSHSLPEHFPLWGNVLNRFW